jgi:hypothetical protein
MGIGWLNVFEWITLWLLIISQVAAQGEPAPPPSTPAPQHRPAISEFRNAELASADQLILVLSNATDNKGNRQEVLVFLGRTKNRGWETIGLDHAEELSEHWRGVSKRVLAPYTESQLTSEQVQKVQLAVEVSIAQFQRMYHELRTDFLDQPDQQTRLAVLANDDRYERLRQLGRDGLFRENSLVAKVINQALEDARPPQ